MSEGLVDLRKILILNPTDGQLIDLLILRIDELKQTNQVKASLIEDLETLAIEIKDRLVTD